MPATSEVKMAQNERTTSVFALHRLRFLLIGLVTSVLIVGLTRVGWTGTAADDPSSATPEQVGMSSERLKRLDAAIHAYVDRGRTPGVVTLIARHGKIVHVDAYGPADLASGRKIRDDDIFRMYSMTKPITSVALLMLYEEGKFQLTDPLGRYMPAFNKVKVFTGFSAAGDMLLDSPKRPITVQDVFRHTAGFTYGLFGDTPVDKEYQKAKLLDGDLKGFIEKLPTLPLLYQPGERWVYSISHDVQAALVEQLSGMKFDEYVRRKIFAPLGMKDAIFKMTADMKARVPTLYSAGANGKIEPAENGVLTSSYGDAAFGGHSISSTGRDYARFAQMLLNGGELNGARLLSPKTVELMTVNHLPERALSSPGSIGLNGGSGYGLGVSVLANTARNGNIGSAGEFGWSGAASTHFLVDPKEDLVAIYLTQLMAGDAGLRSEFVTLVYQSIIGK